MKLKSILTITTILILGLTALSSCGGSTGTTAGSSNTGTGTGTATGTLTILGDAVVPTSVTVTTATFEDNGFASGVVWPVTIGSDKLTLAVGLSHDGVAATEFPTSNLAYYIGGQDANPTDYYTWFGTGKTAGLVVDKTARTATFTGVIIPGGLHFTGTPGATTSVAVTTSLTLNGTITY